MRATASSIGVDSCTASTGEVIASATVVAPGSRRSATTRTATSRSVSIPTGRRFSSSTTNVPTQASRIRRAASSTLSPGEAT